MAILFIEACRHFMRKAIILNKGDEESFILPA
jgi:hypothetical protein